MIWRRYITSLGLSSLNRKVGQIVCICGIEGYCGTLETTDALTEVVVGFFPMWFEGKTSGSPLLPKRRRKVASMCQRPPEF
jgi:hypothetical protein